MSKRCHQKTKPPSRPMTPGEQIALMKVIDVTHACENQDPTASDLKVKNTTIQPTGWAKKSEATLHFREYPAIHFPKYLANYKR